MNFLFFAITYFVICNWFQLFNFLSIIIGPKYKTSSINDKWIKLKVKEKTGLSLLDITIFHDKKMYGMMVGLPFWPKMVLSEGLYKTLNKDELEWVILHEAAHCVLWHNLQAFIIEMLILCFGVYVISLLNVSLLLSLILAIVLSILCIQIIRWTIEYVADAYSISRVSNPNGVITAQNKFRNAYDKNLFNSEKSLLRFLFYWNIYPSKRIEMAQKRLSNTQKATPF